MTTIIQDLCFENAYFHSAGVSRLDLRSPKQIELDMEAGREHIPPLCLTLYLTQGLTTPPASGRPLHRYNLWGPTDEETILIYYDLLRQLAVRPDTLDSLQEAALKRHGVKNGNPN